MAFRKASSLGRTLEPQWLDQRGSCRPIPPGSGEGRRRRRDGRPHAGPRWCRAGTWRVARRSLQGRLQDPRLRSSKIIKELVFFRRQGARFFWLNLPALQTQPRRDSASQLPSTAEGPRTGARALAAHAEASVNGVRTSTLHSLKHSLKLTHTHRGCTGCTRLYSCDTAVYVVSATTINMSPLQHRE